MLELYTFKVYNSTQSQAGKRESLATDRRPAQQGALMLHIHAPPGNGDYTALLDDLHSLVQSGELLVEDFAAIHERYSRLRSSGHPFSTEFELLMRLLSQQAAASFEDSDNDLSVDDGQSEDEVDEVPFGERRVA